MPISHEFQFRSPPATGASAQKSDIHPMELVVQAIVGDSLDALATQLQTLHESQVVLIARLKVIEEKLRRWELQTDLKADIHVMHDRLVEVKKRLKAVLGKLQEIEKGVKTQVSASQSV